MKETGYIEVLFDYLKIGEYKIDTSDVNNGFELMVILELLFGETNIFKDGVATDEMKQSVEKVITEDSSSDFSRLVASLIFQFVEIIGTFDVRGDIPIDLYENCELIEVEQNNDVDGTWCEMEKAIEKQIEPIFHVKELYSTMAIPIRSRTSALIEYINHQLLLKNHTKSNQDFINFFNGLDTFHQERGESLGDTIVSVFDPEEFDKEYQQWLINMLNITDGTMVEYQEVYNYCDTGEFEKGDIKFLNALFLYQNLNRDEYTSVVYTNCMETYNYWTKKLNREYDDECERGMKKFNITFDGE